MSHGKTILASQYAFEPFKRAANNRNSKHTPTLSPWSIITFNVDFRMQVHAKKENRPKPLLYRKVDQSLFCNGEYY